MPGPAASFEDQKHRKSAAGNDRHREGLPIGCLGAPSPSAWDLRGRPWAANAAAGSTRGTTGRNFTQDLRQKVPEKDSKLMLYKLTARAVKHHRIRHHYRRLCNGHGTAALRALTGARILLGLSIEAGSQANAAAIVGSNVRYVVAACLVLQSEDTSLLSDVLAGRMPLLAAAGSLQARELISAYRAATPRGTCRRSPVRSVLRPSSTTPSFPAL